MNKLKKSKPLKKMKLILVFYCLFFNEIFTSTANDINCYLPDGCRLESGYVQDIYEMNEIANRFDISMIMCDINNNEFVFKFKVPPKFLTDEKCHKQQVNAQYNPLIFRWTSKESTILNKQFNFSNVFKYINYMRHLKYVHLWGLKGFDLNFLSEKIGEKKISSGVYFFQLSKLRLDFYRGKKKISSCNDISKSNFSYIKSIFQIRLVNINIHNTRILDGAMRHFELRNVEYKQSICPLVFENSQIPRLVLIDLVDTFYKRNFLSFQNQTYGYLRSIITFLELHKIQNLNLDLKFLHPSVFSQTKCIIIGSASLNSIDIEIFRSLKELLIFEIDPIIFRKINHKQGVEWIRQWNLGVNVNLTKMRENILRSQIYLNISKNVVPKMIILRKGDKNTRKRMSIIFPDEDFCMYVDFPFNQFVIFYENIEPEINFVYKQNEFSCTYFWLTQYYGDYSFYFAINKKSDIFTFLTATNLMRVLKTKLFKSSSKCNFEQRIALCNKSNYQVKDIWDESDFFILSKKMQTAFKIMLYPTDFLGLITNIIVIFVIIKKENTDLFKEFKQYSYLYLNSIFCIIIMVIELLSWITECFYPFEVFCPEIRKLVPIQFFKIIFKECLITLLRFMCSFTYIAFALNRISLIGKDHGKLVTFFSKLAIKIFIGVALLISCSLSWIKGFKYQVNYFFPYLNYPMSTEMDISLVDSNTFNDAYFIINFISDLFNYVLFVVTCVIIDICMVVQLRRVLGEKTKKIESMNQKQNDTKKAENENVVNKAIKMIVLNITIGIFFKLPASFIPLLNVVADYYYKDKSNIYNQPGFGEFYSMLQDTELISVIQDISYFLYTLSLSIQIFIYYGFDKKFQTGFERLKNGFKTFNNAQSIID